MTGAGHQRTDHSLTVALCAAAIAALGKSAVQFLMDPVASDFYGFYVDGSAWNAGTALYAASLPAPNLNTPLLSVVLFGPLAHLPLQAAASIWMLLSCAGFVLSVAVVGRTLNLSRVATVRAGALLGLVAASRTSVVEAQITWILLVPVTLAWAAARNRRPIVSGLWLSLLIAAKPPAALIAFALPWPTFLAAGVSSAALSLLGVAVTGVDPWRDWLRVGGDAWWISHAFNASLWGAATRWVGASSLGELNEWVVVATVSFSSLLIAVARVSVPVDLRWLRAVLLYLLVSPLGWFHYLPWVFGPVAALDQRWRLPLIIVLLFNLPGGYTSLVLALALFWLPSWGAAAHPDEDDDQQDHQRAEQSPFADHSPVSHAVPPIVPRLN